VKQQQQQMMMEASQLVRPSGVSLPPAFDLERHGSYNGVLAGPWPGFKV